jgi:1,2-diacylglycerol 3-alpha-glucosyltransferase
MHILHVTGTYPPSINGVAVSIANLKKEQEKLGLKVTILAPDNPKAKKERGVLRYPSIDNPLIKDYPIPLFPGLRTILKLLNGVDPDIVHVHHPFHIGYFARLIAKHYKAPLVFTYHTKYDVYAEKYLEFLPKEIKAYFLENRINDFCCKCDLVISPSRHITAILKKTLKGKKVITLASPAVGFKITNYSKNYLRKKLNLPFDKKLLLCVGRLAPEKDISLLVKSVKYLSGEFVLVLVGGGEEEKKLKQLAKRLNMGRRVIFTGLITHSKVGKYYQAADYFYYSSSTETQGLIFLEAATFGLPVVAVDSEAARDWVKEEFGILTKSTAKSLANGMLEIEKKDYGKASSAAKAFAEGFTSKKLVGKLVATYKQAIKRQENKGKNKNKNYREQ